MDAQTRQQPAPDEGAHNADGDIGYETKTSPSHDLAGKPSRYKPDKQDDQQTLT